MDGLLSTIQLLALIVFVFAVHRCFNPAPPKHKSEKEHSDPTP